jgi:hypothetical protein
MKFKKSYKEQFSFSFMGLKFEAKNPGSKTFLFLILLLVFAAFLIWQFNTYIVSLIAINGSKTLVSEFIVKLSSIAKLFKGSSNH